MYMYTHMDISACVWTYPYGFTSMYRKYNVESEGARGEQLSNHRHRNLKTC